jgi:hypothetical protein
MSSVQIYIFIPEHISRSRIAGSYGHLHLRNCQFVFKNSSYYFTFPVAVASICLSPHPNQHLFFSGLVWFGFVNNCCQLCSCEELDSFYESNITLKSRPNTTQKEQGIGASHL